MRFNEVLQQCQLKEWPLKYYTEIFENFTQEFQNACSIKKVKEDCVVAYAQSKSDSVYVLLEGAVKVINHHITGNIYEYAYFQAPEFLGEFEAFSECDYYRGTVVATKECLFLVIPKEVFIAWMKQDSNALFIRTTSITKQLVHQVSNERNFLFLSGMERLMLYFCNFYEKHHVQSRAVIYTTNEHIAYEIGFSLKTVNRCIKKLKEQGLISFQGRKKYISSAQYIEMTKGIEDKLVTK